MERRAFLQLLPAAFFQHGGAAFWRKARALVRSGSLGRVVFCRASRDAARWLRFVCDGAVPVWEHTERDELVLCGTEATLVVDRDGYRRFA